MKHIFIFDVDDTLIDTKAKVLVRDTNGKVIDEVGTMVHNNRQNKGELGSYTLDYSQFESLDQILSEPKLPAWRELQYVTKRISEVVGTTYEFANISLCTARQNKQMLKDWLDYSGIREYRVGIRSVDFERTKTTAEGKALYINELIDQYDGENLRFHIWEDNVDNIKAMREAICARSSENIDRYIDVIFNEVGINL